MDEVNKFDKYLEDFDICNKIILEKNVLFTYLTGASNSTIAAAEINAILKNARRDPGIWAFIGRFICTLAVNHPLYAYALAQLVVSMTSGFLKENDGIATTLGARFDVDLEAYCLKYWEEFPDTTDDKDYSAKTTKAINYYTFLAHILVLEDATRTTSQRVAKVDEALFVITQALETETVCPGKVACAAVLLTNATKYLWIACTKRNAGGAVVPPSFHGLKLWQVQLENGPNRWGRWKDSLISLVLLDQLAGRERTHARSAYMAMGLVENEEN